MMDEQILKALKLCNSGFQSCLECPFFGEKESEELVDCTTRLIHAAYELAVNQQKEIERWKNACLAECVLSVCPNKQQIRIEAVKEFAERLKSKIHNYYPSIDSYCTSRHVVLAADIDDLAKEMTKENENA